ncbi:hypothetical protein CHELA1G11_11004 [Hyphomicrobiales bacterium]|nr:hypothetical protein CHELA1G11_11004 [Hyphomicrobiales bacterium]CAH1670801.1 hypothetical protein CHELA1G2_13305 [Hyphomicrobiales bacterium]
MRPISSRQSASIGRSHPGTSSRSGAPSGNPRQRLPPDCSAGHSSDPGSSLIRGLFVGACVEMPGVLTGAVSIAEPTAKSDAFDWRRVRDPAASLTIAHATGNDRQMLGIVAAPVGDVARAACGPIGIPETVLCFAKILLQ